MNLYTCKHYFPFVLIIIVLLIPIAMGIYFLFNFAIKNPFVDNPKKLLISGIILLSAGIIFMSLYFCVYIDYYKNVFAKKDTSALQTVEGNITNLVTTDFLEARYDKFDINGIEFTISTLSLAPGYSKTAAYGGVLNEEGMHVKIAYIEYKNEIYIMSIDKY